MKELKGLDNIVHGQGAEDKKFRRYLIKFS